MVSISRYDRANDDGSTLWTFRHELGHACSHIRRQIATRNGSPLNAGEDYTSGADNYCRYRSQGYQQFSFMGEFMHPENARETGTCVSNAIRSEVRSRSDQSYIENACYGAKVEEGLAEAFAILTATPEDVFFNLKRSCTYPPSRLHLTGHKIVQCIVQHSQRFRNVVLQAPVCRADQPEAPEASGTEAGIGQPGRSPFMNNVLLSSPAVSPTPVVAPAPAPSPATPSQGSQQ
jgi:hypothetical protein